MADQIDPQQINDLNENLKSLNETLGRAAGAGKTGSGASLGGSGGLGDMLGLGKKTSATLDGLGRSAADLTKNLAAGKKGAQVFTDALEGLATAIYLIPGLGTAAKLAALATVAFAKTIGAVTKQGDALFKTYQDLGKVGATASTGLQGVFTNMQKFGYGIEELDKMVKLVSENSETLAKFSLTAADGTNSFASSMQDLVRDEGLRVLGKLPDDINAAGAAYIRQQVASGRSQKDIGESLSAGTKKYIMDLDRLQQLTGTSADALQKQQDDARSEDAYNDVMAELEARAATGDANATAQIKKITTTMASLSPEMQKEFQKSLGGDISAGAKLFARYPSLMKNINDETASLGQTMGDAKKDVTTYIDTFGRSYRLNAEGMREYGGALRGAREEALQFADFDERNASAEANRKVTDKATKNLAAVDLANMNSRDALQSFVQMGVEPATNALRVMANIARGGTGMLPGGVGIGGANSFENKLNAYGTGGTNVDQILATIKQRESRGDYGIKAPGSSASGAYQFIDSTWQAKTKQYGIGEEYSSARMAPKEIQDAIAKRYVEDILKQAGGDVSKVPLAWYTGNIQGKISPEAMAANGGLSPEAYQAKWMKDYSGGRSGWQNSMNGVNPSTTLPPSVDGEKAKNAANASESDGILGMIASGLANLDRNTRESNDKLARISTNTQ